MRRNYREADLDPRSRALCDFASKLALSQGAVGPADIEALRAQGLDDEAISSAIQVVGYFSYVTRVADAVGIDDEPEFAGYDPE